MLSAKIRYERLSTKGASDGSKYNWITNRNKKEIRWNRKICDSL
jgi:regulator of PEP synthase PpsR (kinase-PPPase family)